MKTKLIYTLAAVCQAIQRDVLSIQNQLAWHLPADPWNDLRLVLVLNHTSLYEPLFAGFLPNRFLKNIAHNGLVPVADKTLKRPVVGRFYRVVAGNVVPVTRLRDNSWAHFIDTSSAAVLLSFWLPKAG